MIKTYMTNRGLPIHLCSIDEINFKKITSGFKLNKKTVKTIYSLPRIAFIGNFRTLSLTCQRQIAKTLGFEYINDIPIGTIGHGEMQILINKWPDITNFTKLIILGDPCVRSNENGSIDLDWDAEFDLFKTYKRDKKPVYLKYNIPVVMESEIVRLHSKYPVINNNTIWENEPTTKDQGGT